MVDQDRVIALNRFGLGAKPGDLDRVRDARGWLLGQLKPQPMPTAFSRLPDSRASLRWEYRAMQMLDKAEPGGISNNGQSRALHLALKNSRAAETGNEFQARIQQAVHAEDAFVERLVQFWSNHFAVSVDKVPAALYVGALEREAIRPHLFDDFSGMLLAVETHPAILRYLDNFNSVGADSTYVRRTASAPNASPNRPHGLNENLAREIFELHTLGVNGGYTQNDVIELARAITGWGLAGMNDDLRGTGPFAFHALSHEPGVRVVLGKRYGDAGVEQGRSILRDLARHPATAHHLSFKLARHFVSDKPPASLVDRLSRRYLDSGGYLPELYRALIESEEAWASTAEKFKTPEEWLVSSCRACALSADTPQQLSLFGGLLEKMGQPPFDPRSPAGFPDTTADWIGPDALYKRIQASEALAELSGTGLSGIALARAVAGDTLDPETANALIRADSPRQSIALWLASPAFQWR